MKKFFNWVSKFNYLEFMLMTVGAAFIAALFIISLVFWIGG